MVRVLIVDDSPVQRRLIARMLSDRGDIEVVGSAADPYEARECIVRLVPDVLTLDIHMPRMDGLSFLRQLMKHHPMPVVVFSAFTPRDSELALKAMDLGAMQVLCKAEGPDQARATFERLADAVRAAGRVRLKHPRQAPRGARQGPRSGAAAALRARTSARVIAIGASTGGTQALQKVLCEMPADAPPILVVQHMPAHFTASFAKRLDGLCALTVREAQHGDAPAPGLALIAPGDFHMTLDNRNGAWAVSLHRGPRVNFQRPAADVLFRSVAAVAGSAAVGVLLTGMGKDGAEGLLAMRQKGAFTIAQDEHSCVVFGMPREAIRLGAAATVQPLERIAQRILTPPPRN